MTSVDKRLRSSEPAAPPLSWARQDVEQRLFFPGARHTRVNNWLAASLGLALAISFYAVLYFAVRGSEFAKMFTELGVIPFVIVFFACWSIAILFIKWRKLSLQRRALRYEVVPRENDFVLSAATVDQVIERIYTIADDPKRFLLYNRIIVALANLKNLGRVSDLDEIFNTQAENDESASETSYAVLGGCVWGIPVLGFIGTVLGLSHAIGGFGAVLQSAGADMSAIKTELVAVTGGLSLAFVTTLQALVAAFGIQLTSTFLKKSEQEFLDDCKRYCMSQIVNRLRIMPFERGAEK
jgi:biopolymer transport protein ExbB/TolQ